MLHGEEREQLHCEAFHQKHFPLVHLKGRKARKEGGKGACSASLVVSSAFPGGVFWNVKIPQQNSSVMYNQDEDSIPI